MWRARIWPRSPDPRAPAADHSPQVAEGAILEHLKLEQKFDSHIINKNQLKYRKQNAYILKKMTGFNDVGREKK